MISCFKNAYLNFETAREWGRGRELSLSPSVFFPRSLTPLQWHLSYGESLFNGHLYSGPRKTPT